MAIAVDAQTLIWGIKKEATENRKHMIARASHFFEKCQSDRQQVIIPAQSLSEFLVGYSIDQQQKSVAALSRSFIVAPFDAKAAMIAAQIQDDWDEVKQIMREHGIVKQHIKADINILATAITVGATHLYSEDGQMRSLAKGRILIANLPEVSVKQSTLPGMT